MDLKKWLSDLADMLSVRAKLAASITALIAAWIAIGGWMPASEAELRALTLIVVPKPDLDKAFRQLKVQMAQSDVDQYERAVESRILRQGAIERDIRDHGQTESLDAEQRVNAEALARDKNNLFRAQEELRKGGE